MCVCEFHPGQLCEWRDDGASRASELRAFVRTARGSMPCFSGLFRVFSGAVCVFVCRRSEWRVRLCAQRDNVCRVPWSVPCFLFCVFSLTQDQMDVRTLRREAIALLEAGKQRVVVRALVKALKEWSPECFSVGRRGALSCTVGAEDFRRRFTNAHGVFRNSDVRRSLKGLATVEYEERRRGGSVYRIAINWPELELAGAKVASNSDFTADFFGAMYEEQNDIHAGFEGVGIFAGRFCPDRDAGEFDVREGRVSHKTAELLDFMGERFGQLPEADVTHALAARRFTFPPSKDTNYGDAWGRASRLFRFVMNSYLAVLIAAGEVDGRPFVHRLSEENCSRDVWEIVRDGHGLQGQLAKLGTLDQVLLRLR